MIWEVAAWLQERSIDGRVSNYNQCLRPSLEGYRLMGFDMKKEKGFSLLELLIVVAIILIIATIALPSLLRSRQSANESSAVANIRSFNTAEVSYSSSGGGTFGTIADLTTAGLVDSRFSGTFSG